MPDFVGPLIHVTALLLVALADIPVIRGAPTHADCRIEIANASNGTVILPADGVSSTSCTWLVSAPPGHKLLVGVGHVSMDPQSVVTVTVGAVDSRNFSGRCEHSCLERHLVGETLTVTYERGHFGLPTSVSSNEHPVNSASYDEPISGLHFIGPSLKSNSSHSPISSTTAASGSNHSPDNFAITYLAFDPSRCQSPPTPDYGRVIGRERGLGSRISYRCNPPYVISAATNSKQVATEAVCRTPPGSSPVPTWSAKPPICIIPECGKSPVSLSVGVGDAETTVLLVHPGYPGTWRTSKVAECVWEVSTARKKHLLVHVERADLPHHSTLALYDGKISERRRLDGPNTARVVAGGNFATVAGKLLVVLRTGPNNEATGDDDHPVGGVGNDRAGFQLRVTARKPPCGMPTPPIHGDVRGSELVAVSPSTLASAAATTVSVHQMMVFYSCDTGFQLTGASSSASCSGEGEFTSTAPLCVALPLRVPVLSDSGSVADVEANVSVTLPSMQIVVDGGESGYENGSETVGLPPKSSNPRIFKDRRTHPQSTDEKTNVKAGKDDEINGAKQPSHGAPVDPSVIDWESSAAAATTESTGIADPPPVSSDYDDPPLEEEDQAEGDAFLDDREAAGTDGDEESEEEAAAFPVVAVALGVTLPLLLITLAIAGGVAYRRLYPVRMNMGRKFDTFENPVYNRSKRDPNTTGTLLPGASLETPPRPSAELQRLMTNR